MCSCFDVFAVCGSCMWRDVERTAAKWLHLELCLCVNYTGLDVRVLGIEICV